MVERDFILIFLKIFIFIIEVACINRVVGDKGSMFFFFLNKCVGLYRFRYVIIVFVFFDGWLDKLSL